MSVTYITQVFDKTPQGEKYMYGRSSSRHNRFVEDQIAMAEYIRRGRLHVSTGTQLARIAMSGLDQGGGVAFVFSRSPEAAQLRFDATGVPTGLLPGTEHLPAASDGLQSPEA